MCTAVTCHTKDCYFGRTQDYEFFYQDEGMDTRIPKLPRWICAGRGDLLPEIKMENRCRTRQEGV